MGTARRDGHRQAVTGSYISNYGEVLEHIISVALCPGGTAEAAKNHIKKEIKTIVDPSQIIGISTDGASAYTGVHKGMVELLKHDREFSPKVIFLSDICHKLERLMVHGNIKWVTDTVIESVTLANAIDDSPGLMTFIKNRIKLDETTYTWSEIQKHSKTRFSANVHHHYGPLLRDVPILIESIPLYWNQTDVDDVTLNRVEYILKSVCNSEFIARCILMDRVSSVIALAEIAAQAVDFGAFDSVTLINKVKSKFNELKNDKLKDLKNLIRTNLYKYKCFVGKKENEYQVQLDRIEGFKELRSNSSKADIEQVIVKLEKNYHAWLENIEKHFEKYLELPQAVTLATDIFEESEIDLDAGFKSYQQFINMANVTCKECSSDCQGPACECAKAEFIRFYTFFEKQKRIGRQIFMDRLAKNPKDKSKPISTKEILLSFLNESEKNDKLMNQIYSLNIINCLRVVEVISLLKPNQSSCERTISALDKVVEGKFPMKYKHATEVGIDMVQVGTLIKTNCDFTNFDARLATDRYLANGHLPAMKKNSKEPSKTFQTKLTNSKMPKSTKYKRINAVRLTYDSTELFDDPDDPGSPNVNIDISNPEVHDLHDNEILSNPDLDSDTNSNDCDTNSIDFDPNVISIFDEEIQNNLYPMDSEMVTNQTNLYNESFVSSQPHYNQDLLDVDLDVTSSVGPDSFDSSRGKHKFKDISMEGNSTTQGKFKKQKVVPKSICFCNKVGPYLKNEVVECFSGTDCYHHQKMIADKDDHLGHIFHKECVKEGIRTNSDREFLCDLCTKNVFCVCKCVDHRSEYHKFGKKKTDWVSEWNKMQKLY